ncbi:MAG: insulinase family protein [Bdellovibrio sp.]|nr:insulinase family protein [Bdellovibrio sp.]
MNIWKFYVLTLAIFSVSASAYEVSFEKDTALPIVRLNVAIRAGSVNDPVGKSGATALLAEILLRGTRSKSKQQIDAALDQLGARLETDARAEFTTLRGAVLSDKLDAYLDLLEEILTEPRFSEVEIGKLKDQAISAIQDQLGRDDELGNRAFTRFLLKGHPYGNPVYGTTKSIRALSRKDLIAQYHRVLRSELLLVLGSGDADPERIKRWTEKVAKKCAQYELTPDDRKLIAPVQPPQGDGSFRVQIVDKPERTQTQISGGQIGITMTHPDYMALYVANHAFGGDSFFATLMTEIRVKRGWSYGASSGFRQGSQPRSWHFHLYPAAKDTPAALALTLELVKNLKNKGLSEESFNFAKQSLINNSGFMYDTPAKRVENKLLEKVLQLPDGFMKSYQSKIENVTFAQANRAMNRFLNPEKLAISIVGTAAEIKGPVSKVLQIPEDSIMVEKYTNED